MARSVPVVAIVILKRTARNVGRARTAEGLHRVFAYGSLMVGGTGHFARGDMWLRPGGTAAVDFHGDNWVRGEIIEVDDAGLDDLDVREGTIARRPYYRRILVKTRSNVVCWAYEWARDYRNFTLMRDGRWRWEYLRQWRPRYGERGFVALVRGVGLEEAHSIIRSYYNRRKRKVARLS